MIKMQIPIYNISAVASAFDVVAEHLTDNSCGDPDCCTSFAPSEEDYLEALDTLKGLGLEVEVDCTIRD